MNHEGDEIDRLVDEQLSTGARYSSRNEDRCMLCGGYFHGLPADGADNIDYVASASRRRGCPGAFADEQAKADWRARERRRLGGDRPEPTCNGSVGPSNRPLSAAQIQEMINNAQEAG